MGFSVNYKKYITQVNQYGYPYFHRKFASYGTVNGSYLLVNLGTVIRHHIRGRISAPDITAVYGPFMRRKVAVSSRTRPVSFDLGT
jgi:hypothetical protein